MMSHNVFNLEIHSEVVPAYVGQADGEAILRLQEVEDLVIGWALRKRSPDDAEKFAEWQRMAANDPSLIKGVLSPKYRARKQSQGELSTPPEPYKHPAPNPIHPDPNPTPADPDPTPNHIPISLSLTLTLTGETTLTLTLTLTLTGETTLASSYINSLLEIRQGVDTDTGLNSAIYLLSESGRGILLAWLNSEEATPEAIENI